MKRSIKITILWATLIGVIFLSTGYNIATKMHLDYNKAYIKQFDGSVIECDVVSWDAMPNGRDTLFIEATDGTVYCTNSKIVILIKE